MDFDDTPAEAEFRAEVRAFLEAHATPKRGDERDWSRDGAATDPEVAADFRKRLGKAAAPFHPLQPAIRKLAGKATRADAGDAESRNFLGKELTGPASLPSA